MIKTSFTSIARLRDRIQGLKLLFDIDKPIMYLEDLEDGHTDNEGNAVFFGGGSREIVSIGYYYLTVRLQDGQLAKISIDGTQKTHYSVTFDY